VHYTKTPTELGNTNTLATIMVGKENSMYECFHCGHKSVIWDADFTFEDYGLDGEGLIHHCHCANCGAEIEYYVPITEEDIDELKERFGEHD